MAVDTREKRASLISWGRPWMPQLPLPDGEINTNDRYQIAWLYRFPADVVLFFVKCPPTLTALVLEPELSAIATEPTMSTLAAELILASIVLEPGLDSLAIEPGLEAEDCLT